MSNLHRYLLNSENKKSEEDGRRFSTHEETEKWIKDQLTSDEEIFVSRYPQICQAFDSGVYEFLSSRGFCPRGFHLGSSGIPSGMGYIIARAIAGRICRLVKESDRTAIISSGTYRFKSFEEAKIAIDTAKRNNVCKVVLIVVHGHDHIHVLHDCPLSHGTCKCFSGFIPKRRSAHKHFISELSKACLAKIIFYFLSNDKWIYYFKIGEARFTSTISAAAQDDRLREGRTKGPEGEGILASCDDETGLLLEPEYTGISEGELPTSSQNKGQPVAHSQKRKRQTNITDVIFGKLRMINCSPLKEFNHTDGWHCDEFLKDLDPSKVEVKIAYNRLIFQTVGMSLKEFSTMYNVTEKNHEDDDKYFFGAYKRRDFWKMYFDKEESLKWLKKLLIWQYARDSIDNNGRVMDKDWKPEVYAFVKWLMLLLDGQQGKKNCLYLLSPPNAGKTFFCDLIAHYLLSSAHLTHWNKTTGFPLEDLEGARCVFWNEPSFESNNTPELLKLLGGENLSVKVKYNRPSNVQNIPVIVTSNYVKFPTTPEFNERITYHRWTQCDILINVGKKRLHPYCLDLLFTACENYYEEKIRE